MSHASSAWDSAFSSPLVEKSTKARDPASTMTANAAAHGSCRNCHTTRPNVTAVSNSDRPMETR